MLDYDIIIIGGGPAGSMTGIRLQEKGYKTCIIDKSIFPREKLCGGLLTKKTLELISKNCPQINTNDFIVERTNTVDFYLGNNLITTFKTNIDYFFTERKTFDFILIQEYKKNGGVIYENTKIKLDNIDLENNLIRTSKLTFKYKYLVGADGCNSVLTRKVGIMRHDSFCIEGETFRNPNKKKEFRIYFGVAKKGYGWYFPKKNYYSVGIGGDNKNRTIQIQANHFFTQFGIDNIKNQKGALIPSGKLFNLLNLHNNTIVVGDAAGFVDPITGEGLYFALLSGTYAADAIHDANSNITKSVKNLYLLKVKLIRKNISVARFLQKILYFPLILKLFMKYLQKNKSFALFYLENVMSTNDFNYINFFWLYILRHRQNGNK